MGKAIQITTFVMAAFGGFLEGVAPPDGWETRFAVGLSSIIALCVLLFISGVSERATGASARKGWLVASAIVFALSVALGLLYSFSWGRLTFAYPPESQTSRFIAGRELTVEAQQYRKRQPAKTVSETVADFGGPQFRERIWEASSLQATRLLLIGNYTAFVLAVSATIFCLTEGAHRTSSRARADRKHR